MMETWHFILLIRFPVLCCQHEYLIEIIRNQHKQLKRLPVSLNTPPALNRRENFHQIRRL